MCRPDQGSLNLDCALGLAKRTTCDRAENCRFWHQGKYTHFSVVHWHIVLSRTKWGKNSRGKNSRACWSTFPCCTSICSFLVSDLVIWQNGTLSQDKFITILSPTAKKVHAYTHTHTRSYLSQGIMVESQHPATQQFITLIGFLQEGTNLRALLGGLASLCSGP